MKRTFRIAFVVLDGMIPPVHGGSHMLRATAEGFAQTGHRVLVLTPFGESNACDRTVQTVAKLQEGGIEFRRSENGTIRFTLGPVQGAGVEAVSDRFLPFVVSELRRFGAEVVVLTDIGGAPAHTTLRVVMDRFSGLVVYNPMTVHMLPNGPLAIEIDAEAARALRKCRIVVPSAFLASYIAQHFGATAHTTIPPMFRSTRATPPSPQDRFGQPFGNFNPNIWKGLPILLSLADQRPDVSFVVHHGWRTSSHHLRELRQRANIALEPHGTGSVTIYDRASAILVPSLCYEALGLVAIEAMLRVLPAVTARHGGLAEAGLGAALIRDVAPLGFRRLCRQPGPFAEEFVPDQPIAGWLEALDTLRRDRSLYTDLARFGWQRANDFVESLSWDATSGAFFG
jgi:glycosyltransferase involved in cell wall biosynthesis